LDKSDVFHVRRMTIDTFNKQSYTTAKPVYGDSKNEFVIKSPTKPGIR
jgi:hypothetical protein